MFNTNNTLQCICLVRNILEQEYLEHSTLWSYFKSSGQEYLEINSNSVNFAPLYRIVMNMLQLIFIFS